MIPSKLQSQRKQNPNQTRGNISIVINATGMEWDVICACSPLKKKGQRRENACSLIIQEAYCPIVENRVYCHLIFHLWVFTHCLVDRICLYVKTKFHYLDLLMCMITRGNLEMLYYAIPNILEFNHVKPSQMPTNYKLQISFSPGYPSGVWGMEGLGRGDGWYLMLGDNWAVSCTWPLYAYLPCILIGSLCRFPLALASRYQVKCLHLTLKDRLKRSVTDSFYFISSGKTVKYLYISLPTRKHRNSKEVPCKGQHLVEPPRYFSRIVTK